jgi:hypothetical protein
MYYNNLISRLSTGIRVLCSMFQVCWHQIWTHHLVFDIKILFTLTIRRKGLLDETKTRETGHSKP